jgi:hypothetical protein
MSTTGELEGKDIEWAIHDIDITAHTTCHLKK